MYNLIADPLEMKNLINSEDFIQVKNDLRKRFEEYREKLSE